MAILALCCKPTSFGPSLDFFWNRPFPRDLNQPYTQELSIADHSRNFEVQILAVQKLVDVLRRDVQSGGQFFLREMIVLHIADNLEDDLPAYK